MFLRERSLILFFVVTAGEAPARHRHDGRKWCHVRNLASHLTPAGENKYKLSKIQEEEARGGHPSPFQGAEEESFYPTTRP